MEYQKECCVCIIQDLTTESADPSWLKSRIILPTDNVKIKFTKMDRLIFTNLDRII